MLRESHYGKSIRKIVDVGGAEGISLPKQYLRNNSLEKGNRVEVIYNHSLKLTPLNEYDIKQELEEKPKHGGGEANHGG